jgi:hypothetical protein
VTYVKDIDDKQLAWSGKTQVAEASTLGLKPGEWPLYVNVRDTRMGGERLFKQRRIVRGPEMDVLHVDYETAGGRRLRIIND